MDVIVINCSVIVCSERLLEFYYPVNSASVFFELLISNLKNRSEGVQFR